MRARRRGPSANTEPRPIRSHGCGRHADAGRCHSQAATSLASYPAPQGRSFLKRVADTAGKATTAVAGRWDSDDNKHQLGAARGFAMTQPKSLAQSIRVALDSFQQPTRLSVEELRQLAARAKAVNEEAITFLSGLPPAPSEHGYVALQLNKSRLRPCSRPPLLT